MGRKQKFGQEIRAFAIGLRSKGHTLGDVQAAIRRQFGEAPELMWISRLTKAAPPTSRETQVADMVAIVDEQAEQSEQGVDLDVAMLRRQLKQIEDLRDEKDIGPASVAALARVFLQTLTEIRKREPPLPPAKEIPPDWLAIETSARVRMHALLDRILEANGQPAQIVPDKG